MLNRLSHPVAPKAGYFNARRKIESGVRGFARGREGSYAIPMSEGENFTLPGGRGQRRFPLAPKGRRDWRRQR